MTDRQRRLLEDEQDYITTWRWYESERRRTREEDVMDDWREVYGSYLAAKDLPDDFARVVTIKGAIATEIASARDGESPQRKLVIDVGGKKDVPLGPTQCAQIEGILGTGNPRRWVGQKVEMFKDMTVMMGGRSSPGIRFRAVAGHVEPEPEPPVEEDPLPPDDDDIPF